MPKMGVFGYLGSGKGVIETYITYKDYYLNGYTIISNMDFTFASYETILENKDHEYDDEYNILVENGIIAGGQLLRETPLVIKFDDISEDGKQSIYDKLIEYAVTATDFPIEWGVKILIVGDEFYLYAESRGSTRVANTLLGYLWFQTRKRHTSVIISGPRSKYNDPRLRENLDRAIKCFKHHYVTDELCYDEECIDPHWFEFDILDLHNERGTTMNIDDQKILEKIFTLYNTEQLIASPQYQLRESDVEKEFDTP